MKESDARKVGLLIATSGHINKGLKVIFDLLQMQVN